MRDDLLDYAVEVEWADSHIGRMLDLLEKSGELDRTLIIVTSDHLRHAAIPFREACKYTRTAFICRWPCAGGAQIKPGRVVEDFVNVRDLAPTFLELAGVPRHAQITGMSLTIFLKSDQSGQIEPDRNVMLVGKERHDLGRPHDWGYPVRAIRTKEASPIRSQFLSRSLARGRSPDRLRQLRRQLDQICCSSTIGGCYYDLSFGKRQPDELYRLSDDAACVRNLAHDLAFAKTTADDLRSRMMDTLRDEQDPRIRPRRYRRHVPVRLWRSQQAKAIRRAWLKAQADAASPAYRGRSSQAAGARSNSNCHGGRQSRSAARVENSAMTLRFPPLKHSITEVIGGTPLVELHRLLQLHRLRGRVLAKLDFLNPGLSKKDRIALEMIRQAKSDGLLAEGQTVVELTSGNAGTGLAIVCRALGHPFVAVMSRGNSVERARMIEALGAEVVLGRPGGRFAAEPGIGR